MIFTARELVFVMMDTEVFIAIENEPIVGPPAIGVDDRIKKAPDP
jgi:hypothetical protein